MDSFTFDAVVIAAVLLLTVASMGGWFGALIGEPPRRVYISGMANKPDPDYGDDRYSEEETARRRDATVKAMIGMKPKPREPIKPKGRATKKRQTT